MTPRTILLCLMVGVAPLLHAQTESVMTHRARGTFDVKVIPQPADDAAGGPFGRLFLDKKFHGPLHATSNGQMIGFRSAVEGSAGYVALEQVTGALDGREGTFVLQHNGTMQGNVPSLTVTVVPDSGTGQLVGLSGRMAIIIEGKAHSYEFEYAFKPVAK